MRSRRPRLRTQYGCVRGVHTARVQPAPHSFEERRRIGMRLYLFVSAQNDFAQLFVVPPGSQQIAQSKEVCVTALVCRFEHLLQHLGAQQLALLLVHQPEIGRDAERRGLLTRERQAQRMHSRNFGTVHEKQLTAQARVLRVLGCRLRQRRTDTLTHLCGGGVGKGHEQQPVNVNGVARIGQACKHTLDQHSGLARAGRR